MDLKDFPKEGRSPFYVKLREWADEVASRVESQERHIKRLEKKIDDLTSDKGE